mmetsp:Transcript_32631/g.66541  ORF Transcript_32631/g.66541 Transcript_32631/m.66541 type:complete len:614 (-) Transcript_32631:25-1866(-)
MTKPESKQRVQSSSKNNIGAHSFEDMKKRLRKIFDDTVNGTEQCNMRALTETILAMAKIAKILRQQGKSKGEDSSRVILRRLLLIKDMKPNRNMFQFFAGASMDIIREFDERHLSNLAYAYALIDYVPEFDDGIDLFDHITMNAVDVKAEFIPQGIFNMAWAYATVGKPHAVLFEAMGDQVVAFEYLGGFRPQALSNTLWAYSKAGVNHPQLFQKVAKHVVESDSLDRFKSQDISNMVWAYATADVPHAKLFQRVANHIVASDSLDRFYPQDLAITVWAFATASVHHSKLFEKVANNIVGQDNLDRFKPQEISNIMWAYAKASFNNPRLFEKMASHIVESDSLDRFDPQAFSNIVWAYSAAGVRHPKLFQKVANHIVDSKSLDRFDPQALANLLWSYATMGITDKQLFSSFVPTAAKLIDSYTNQGLANIAWAYAAADVDAPILFNAHFINKCVEKGSGFEIEHYRQLHQWHLWQTKEKSNSRLPVDFQERCYDIFISEEPTVSKLQDDVVAQLLHIGLETKEEVLVGSGYRIDAIVKVNGKTIGIEADGPSHFIGRSKSPSGSTILKRRQVSSIDGIELVSVPYWNWDTLGNDEVKKQEYLRHLLGWKIDNE